MADAQRNDSEEIVTVYAYVHAPVPDVQALRNLLLDVGVDEEKIRHGEYDVMSPLTLPVANRARLIAGFDKLGVAYLNDKGNDVVIPSIGAATDEPSPPGRDLLSRRRAAQTLPRPVSGGGA